MDQTHTKRSSEFQAEIEELIDKSLGRQWQGDSEGEGIRRIIEILRQNTTDSVCLVNAKADEPIFVLRAKDPLAAEAVRSWIQHAEARDIHNDKLNDAIICAEQMDTFRRRIA